MTIGERIQQRREELGLTQDELAEKVGYSTRFSIVKIESGKSSVPTKKLDIFAKALHTTVSYLLGKENEDEYYYLNEDTKKVAKAAFENKDIKTLTELAMEMSPDKLKAYINFMQELKKENK